MKRDFARAFRLGDVRGLYPDELDEAFAYGFARAFAAHFNLSGNVATGRDMRGSSESLQAALNEGFCDAGLTVLDLGLSTTELGYFASTRPHVSAAIIVTASHNPASYNGFKCVLRDGEAVTFDSGLSDVRLRMQSPPAPVDATQGQVKVWHLRDEYLDFLAAFFPGLEENTGRIALNGLNGTAATLADDLAARLRLPVSWFRRHPGPIPAEGADPVKPQLSEEMRRFMAGDGHAFGVAWDGDCDRCVFFDGEGGLVPTYYVVGLLAAHFLSHTPGGTVVFDTKLCWNTLDIIARHDGRAAPAETGHAFMKRAMRNHRAIYGGELSSHHYFGDFFGCDSGMFAWLKLVEILSIAGVSIGDLVDAQRQRVRCTPEINVALVDVDAAFLEVNERYGRRALSVDSFDGPSYVMPGDWRFSLRRSKTEPLVRINFECRGSADDMLGEASSLLRLLETWRDDDRVWDADLRIQ